MPSSRSMHLLTDTAYLAAGVLASPWLLYKWLTDSRYRAGLGERWGRGPVRPENAHRLWIHAASVGEVNGIRRLASEWDKAHPDGEVVVSTVTLTGQEIAKSRYGPRAFLWPLDWSGAVRRAFDRVKPTAIVLYELEIWPNFLVEAAARDIPVFIVNGRLTEKSLRGWSRWSSVRKAMVRAITAVSAQNEAYAERFHRLGVPEDRVIVSGNMKFDGLPGPKSEAERSSLLEEIGWTSSDRIIVGGSIHPPEHEYLLDAWKILQDQGVESRLVLVPRHPERADEIVRRIEGAGVPCYKRTSLKSRQGADSRPILVVDTVGELAALYDLADAVFVGGSLAPRGGQNMLEPVALGKPTVFGPGVENFRDSVDLLLKQEAARQIPSADQLAEVIGEFLSGSTSVNEMADRGRTLLENERGATARNLEMIYEHLSERGVRDE